MKNHVTCHISDKLGLYYRLDCQLNSIGLTYSQSQLPFTEATHLCYTVIMDENQHIWRVWADQAYRWGISEWTASLLDGIGPLSFLGAQAIYLVQPLLSPLLPGDHLSALAQLLEEPDQTRAFTMLLREGNPQ